MKRYDSDADGNMLEREDGVYVFWWDMYKENEVLNADLKKLAYENRCLRNAVVQARLYMAAVATEAPQTLASYRFAFERDVGAANES